MPETILAPTGIKLYGRVIKDLELKLQRPEATKPLGDNNFLEKQLQAAGACLARIYSFSYDGRYYELPRTVLFLVHGPGTSVRAAGAGDGSRTTLDASGVMAREWEFSASLADDIVYWEYDKGDFSLRMDIESGPLDQILLETHLRNAAALSSGMDLRSPDPRRR